MEQLNEKSPPGFTGTVKAMIQNHPEIKNPWALSWHLKNKGAKSHYKVPKDKDSQGPGKAEKKEKYKKEDKPKKHKFEEWIEQSHPEFLENKKWIQDIEKKGTEGVCTGSKFGSESCPPGSKRYNLAKTFKKIAKNK